LAFRGVCNQIELISSKGKRMTDLQTRFNAEFDAWFAKVQALTDEVLEPSEEWASFWFDGYAPEEALDDYKSGAMDCEVER
jgi:hypothetical protein